MCHKELRPFLDVGIKMTAVGRMASDDRGMYKYERNRTCMCDPMYEETPGFMFL